MGTIAQQFHNTQYNTQWDERAWDESLSYIKRVVDTAYNPFLILDEHLRVLAANKLFNKLFHVDEKNTEPKYVNEIGNGVWNIHTLAALATGILPRNILFKDIAVSSEYPSIGRKILLLNGKSSSPMMLLAVEDSIQVTVIAAELADYAARIKSRMSDRTQKLEAEVEQLNQLIGLLKTNSKKRV